MSKAAAVPAMPAAAKAHHQQSNQRFWLAMLLCLTMRIIIRAKEADPRNRWLSVQSVFAPVLVLPNITLVNSSNVTTTMDEQVKKNNHLGGNLDSPPFSTFVKPKQRKKGEKPVFDGPWNVQPVQNNTNGSTWWAALCMVAGNEDLYIEEWADYHLGLGFGHIYIYDNGPNHTLQEFGRRKNGVHVIHKYYPKKPKVQQTVYNHCVKNLLRMPNPPRWVMFLDGDEFLVFRQNNNTNNSNINPNHHDKNSYYYTHVTEFLTDHLQEGALQINWLIFGTANETKYRPEPVTKRFQYRRELPDTNSKTVVILDHIQTMKVHYAILKNSTRRVGMGGRKVGLGGSLSHVRHGDTSIAAVYHFMYKSEEEFRTKRCLRGNINEPPIWCEQKTEVGEVFDDTAWQTLLRNVPEYVSK